MDLDLNSELEAMEADCLQPEVGSEFGEDGNAEEEGNGEAGVGLDESVLNGNDGGTAEGNADGGGTGGGNVEAEGHDKVAAPSVGMVFSFMEALDAYYRNYGKQEGFGVVRAAGSVYKGISDGSKKPLRYSTWTFDRYGRPERKRKSNGKTYVTDSSIAEDKSLKTSKKVDCCAKIYASVNADNEWQIRKVVNEHRNHTPKPANSKYIAEYRKEQMTAHLKRKIRTAYAAGLSVAQLHNLLVTERNGHEEMCLTKRDIRNEVYGEKKLKLKDGDAVAMVRYFKKMTEGNQNFFHSYRLDETGQMQDILWVDARSRALYEEFGDVVCFDTTYLTNKYELPFANFVGVNHHGQSILLGCAPISHETTETFQWVFSTWLDCMNNRQPGGILTDQSVAMRRALSIEMPESRHRWCIWHITSKFGDKLGRREDYKELKEDLLKVIYDSFTKEEFEENWRVVMEEYDLHVNTWLNGLYDEKEMWVPAFLKHMFWAGMKTTQRVESIHSFFDDYVKKHTRLYEFADNYCKAMENRAEEERQFDAYSESCVRQIVHGFPAEYAFQRFYTDMKFKEVLRECGRIVHLHCFEKVVLSDTTMELWFEDRVYARNSETRKEFLTQHKRNYCVRYDTVTKVAKCDCCLFECSGIICRHIIKMFSILGVNEVPEYYVLRRWRKDVDRKHSVVKVAYHDPSKNEKVKGYDTLQLRYDPIASKAAGNKELIQLVLELLELMDIRVEERKLMIEKELRTNTPSSIGNGTQTATPASTNVVPDNDVDIRDPPMRVYPHRTTSHCFYTAVEKSVKAKGKKKTSKQKVGGVGGSDGKAADKSRAAAKKGRKGKSGQKEAEQVDEVGIAPHGSALINELPEGSCFQMIDPDGSVGYFKFVGRTQRVLFPHSEYMSEGQASNAATNQPVVDTDLAL